MRFILNYLVRGHPYIAEREVKELSSFSTRTQCSHLSYTNNATCSKKNVRDTFLAKQSVEKKNHDI